jgi:uncharacterized protein (TIGR03067 family)
MPINLTGSWRAVYAELNGQMTPVAHFSGIVITYSGKKFSIAVHGVVEHEGTYSINEKSTPAQITYVYTKSTFFELEKPRIGIVQVNGETFKDCLAGIGDPPPPTFNTTSESNAVMTIHQKSGTETGIGVSVSVNRKVSEW